jgi:GNAT superfamily N-acetyltransferase
MDSYAAWTNKAILKESERWVWYPQSAERIEDDRRFLVHMPEHWGFSIVQRSAVSSEQLAQDLIEHTIQETKEVGGQKLAWQVSEATRPQNMDKLLAERGFEVSEELEVLSFELGRKPEPLLPRMKIFPRTTAELVRTVEGLREVHRIGHEVFSSHLPSEEEIEEYAEHLGKLERREGGEATAHPDELLTLSFLAFVESIASDSEPVASGGVTLAGEVARMWGGGTLKDYRGYGAYRALVLERCRVAHAFGSTLALVKARVGTSGPVLTRAGFELAGTERRYELPLT